MRGLLNVVAPVVLLSLPAPALADTADLARSALTATTVAGRDGALGNLEAMQDSDAVAAYAAGSLQFFVALEKLGAGLHRHGFQSPQSFVVPLMRLPVPDNPNPEPLDYEGFRKLLTDFHDAMAKSAATLAKVPDDADIGLVVDLYKTGIDLNEDGNIAPDESAAAIMAALANSGVPTDGAPLPPLTFRFDRADGYWLQGYANFLMAQADFWLAHDFKSAFDQTFQMLFPKAKLPMQDTLVPLDDNNGSIFSSEWRVADFISFVHLINWQVVEAERSKAARAELLEMIRLSRQDWKAIAAEPDNDREWLPGPRQTGANLLTGMEVTDEQVQAWHAALQMAEDLLEGRKLLPHFRFADKGIDMKKFFEEPQAFDLVLSLTGPGVVPYLEQGEILSSDEWWALQNEFGSTGFMTFAVWAN